MGIFKPNVEKLTRREDIAGLIEALEYRRDEDLNASPVTAERGYSRIRASAATALGNLGSPQALEPLVEAFVKDFRGQYGTGRDEVREAVVFAIKEIMGKDAVPLLLSFLEREREKRVMCALVEALADIGDARAYEPLRKMAQSQVWTEEDASAARHLGAFGDSRAVKDLSKIAMGSQPFGMRQAAIQGLGAVAGPEAGKALEKIRDNIGHIELRSAALDALLKSGRGGGYRSPTYQQLPKAF